MDIPNLPLPRSPKLLDTPLFHTIPKVYTPFLLFLHDQDLHILPFSLSVSKSIYPTSHFPSRKSSHTAIVYTLRKIQKP